MDKMKDINSITGQMSNRVHTKYIVVYARPKQEKYRPYQTNTFDKVYENM